LFFIYVSAISLSGFLYLRYYDLFSEWQRTDRISSNLITDSSLRTASCHAEFYIMDFTIIDFYEFYGFHQLCLAVRKEVLLLTSSGSLFLIIIQSRSVYWSSSSIFICIHHVSIII